MEEKHKNCIDCETGKYAKEFNLSEKIMTENLDKNFNVNHIKILDVEDVKEFIKRLKEHFTPREKTFYTYNMFTPKEFNEFIDKLAGDKLK